MKRGNVQVKSIREQKKTVEKPEEGLAYTYIVECADDSLYTGWTNHLEERVNSHNAGTGAKYTRARLPVRLVYYEVFSTKQEAMKREYAIKQLSRVDKLQLIQEISEEVRTRCEAVTLQSHVSTGKQMKGIKTSDS